jgi:hypothetical protein
LVEDLISPLEKQIKEQLADQTKKAPAATSSRGGSTSRRIVAKKAGADSLKEQRQARRELLHQQRP